VSTPLEIAEYALRMPEVLQTWMHAKVPDGMYSDIEGRVLAGKSAPLNFTKQISIAKNAAGEWEIRPQLKKGTDETGWGSAYAQTAKFIKKNYSPAEQEKIFRTLAGQLEKNPSALCCKIGASADACWDCNSHCQNGNHKTGLPLQKLADRGIREMAAGVNKYGRQAGGQK